MATLLLHLAAPMQSWGLKSAFELRNTMPEPTKSGVLGLLCAALGRDRAEPIEDLVALKMGVRVDKPGTLQYDFQTALNVAKANGSKPDTQLSQRAYLSDAEFFVGLEGDIELLTLLHQALLNPKWPIFLGRKSYLPSTPLVYADKDKAIVEFELIEALKNIPYESSPKEQDNLIKYVLESDYSEFVEERFDVPVSFELDKREFRSRFIHTQWFEVNQGRGSDVSE